MPQGEALWIHRCIIPSFAKYHSVLSEVSTYKGFRHLCFCTVNEPVDAEFTHLVMNLIEQQNGMGRKTKPRASLREARGFAWVAENSYSALIALDYRSLLY